MKKIDFGTVFIQKPVSSNDSVFSTNNDVKITESSSSFKQIVDEQIHNRSTSEIQIDDHISLYDGSRNLILPEDGTTLTEEVQKQLALEDLRSPVEVNNLANNLELNKEESSIEMLSLNTNVEPIVETENKEIIDEIDYKLLELIDEIIHELSISLQMPIDSESLAKLTKAFERLYQLWDELPSEVRRHVKVNQLVLQASELKEATKILNELLSIYEKRQSFLKQQVYAFDATITQQDIKKWLTQALERHSLFPENTNHVAISSNQPLPMSQKQQYTIHATNLERIDAISRNLIRDVQQIVKQSNFLKQPGLNQLTFTLRPASLGEVTIRLVQVDGVMSVKFLVATQAAKELFEANIHQLKPMFAPNQIIIERDLSVSDKQFYQEEGEPLEHNEEQQQSNEHEEKNEQKQGTDISFEELLQLLSKEAISNA